MYQPKFRITPHLLNLIEEIAVFREKIHNAPLQVPWVSKLQREARVLNTHSSTAIEGNPLTLAEVEQLASNPELLTGDELSKREVLNYFAALRFIDKNSKKSSLTKKDILHLHGIVGAKVVRQGGVGEYRKIQVRVGQHFPPHSKDVPRMMKELIDWVNKESKKWSPVISSAILHYQFEEIHPFGDGNGRVGRLLALWDLYRRGFDTHHIFSVDEFYWENRPLYYYSLDSVRRNRGDLTDWLEFATEGLHLTLERVLARIQTLPLGSVKEKLILRPKQEKLLQFLKEKGPLSPREIWDLLEVSKQGAMDLLHPLIKAGIVQKIGSKKSGKYTLGV